MLLELDAGVCAVAPERRILGVELDCLCVEIGGIVELVVCMVCQRRSRGRLRRRWVHTITY